jgi:hypothetical protein
MCSLGITNMYTISALKLIIQVAMTIKNISYGICHEIIKLTNILVEHSYFRFDKKYEGLGNVASIIRIL